MCHFQFLSTAVSSEKAHNSPRTVIQCWTVAMSLVLHPKHPFHRPTHKLIHMRRPKNQIMSMANQYLQPHRWHRHTLVQIEPSEFFLKVMHKANLEIPSWRLIKLMSRCFSFCVLVFFSISQCSNRWNDYDEKTRSRNCLFMREGRPLLTLPVHKRRVQTRLDVVHITRIEFTFTMEVKAHLLVVCCKAKARNRKKPSQNSNYQSYASDIKATCRSMILAGLLKKSRMSWDATLLFKFFEKNYMEKRKLHELEQHLARSCSKNAASATSL